MAINSGQHSGHGVFRVTKSLCTVCVRVVDARIEQHGGQVWMSKACPEHGHFTYRISSDVPYTKASMGISSPGFLWSEPRQSSSGCPSDCGPCVAHLSPAGAAIIELTNACNLPCSTCIAGSDEGGRAFVGVGDVRRAIEGLIAQQGDIPILMLSGGEPTIHPLFFEILAVAKSYPEVGHVMVITNGKRISEELDFASNLAGRYPDVEIYLQFDSLDPRVLLELRGMDLTAMRIGALEHLAEAKIPTSLVVLTNRRVNLFEAGDIVRTGLEYSNVRGVTFQPIRATGRHDAFEYEADGTTLTDVRSAVLGQVDFFDEASFAPHPSSPEAIAVAYLERRSGEAVTDKVNNQIASSPVPPLFWVHDDGIGDLFRVAVVCFYDRFNFCTEGVRRALVQFALRNGSVIPLDTYYLFYESPTYIQPSSLTQRIAT